MALNFYKCVPRLLIRAVEGSNSCVLQAAKNLKAVDDVKLRLSGATKKHAEVAKELKADKASLKLKCQQMDLLTAELATARMDLKVCWDFLPQRAACIVQQHKASQASCCSTVQPNTLR